MIDVRNITAADRERHVVFMRQGERVERRGAYLYTTHGGQLCLGVRRPTGASGKLEHHNLFIDPQHAWWADEFDRLTPEEKQKAFPAAGQTQVKWFEFQRPTKGEHR